MGTKLQTGDVIIVAKPDGTEEEWPVLKVKDNVAVTRYRDFDVRVINHLLIFEYGNKNAVNQYWLKA